MRQLSIFAQPRRPCASAIGPCMVLFLALVAFSAHSQPLALTLDEAIERALEKNENLVIERAGRDIALAAVDGAEGAYDPLLGLSAFYQRSTLPVNSSFSGAPEGKPAPTDERFDGGATLSQLLPTGGEFLFRGNTSRAETNGAFGLLSPAYGSQLGFEFRQPLWRDFDIDPARLGLRVAAADRDRAVASLDREVRDTVAAVERSYWNLVALRRGVEVRQESIELAAEQLTQTEIRIDSGLSPEAELSQPQAEVERRRGELLAAREAVSRAESALKLLILGDDEDELWVRPLETVDEVEMTPVPIDLAIEMERALGARAELTVAESIVERRQVEKAFAVDRIKPSLDFVVSYDRFGLKGDRNRAASAIPGLEGEVPPELEGGWGSALSALVDGDFDDARVGFEFSLPLGNRSARAEAEIARAVERQAAAGVSAARKAIRGEVLDAAAALETAEGRIEAARSARQAADVQLSSERDRFEAGLSTNFLVLTRQNDLAVARLAEIEALTDYRTARAELARATGSLLADRGIDFEDRIEFEDGSNSPTESSSKNAEGGV